MRNDSDAETRVYLCKLLQLLLETSPSSEDLPKASEGLFHLAAFDNARVVRLAAAEALAALPDSTILKCGSSF